MKKLENILAITDGPKRWRASASFCLELNPKNPYDPRMDLRTETAIIMGECKELARALKESGNPLAVSDMKHKFSRGGRRYMLRMPATMLQFITVLDPNLNHGTPAERRKTYQLLTKTFPEFRIVQKI